jgi:hypothetical protein
MKYAAEMGSGSTIYTPNLIKIGSGIQKLRGWGFTDTQAYFHCFKTKKIG